MSRSPADRRERFRKRLVWLYATTLIGVVLLLIAHVTPMLRGIRPWGIGLTFAGGLLQIAATWDYSRRG